VVHLLSRLDELKNGTIQRLEVRAGIPRRLVFETRLRVFWRAEDDTSTVVREESEAL
jgi:hypothetical protein